VKFASQMFIKQLVVCGQVSEADNKKVLTFVTIESMQVASGKFFEIKN
jgi:hypothetical protein